ncbi:MAG: TonB-dependent receptor plug domain-containing protein, partial [Niabella sp.]|nr:TonB-dependent receptor plug domain-containing protein [Niabella sp.]
MRKCKQTSSLLLILLCFVCTSVFGQTKTISGKVSGDDGTPLGGVTVVIKGTSRGTSTNLNGVFTIKATPGEVLQFTSVGYTSQSATVGAENSVNITLLKVSSDMQEVVVTAMDIKRNARELGYSVQTVNGDDIKKTQRENFVTSLQGRVAGLTVTPTSGAAGASAGIVLRGFNTLSGNNQPLFIVDGVIVDNQTLNSNSQSGSGIGLASDGNNRNNDNTNRIADINPNDIESVTVLKGPEATALYGSQANSGAIVITTKKAKATKGKVFVTYDNSFRLQKITRFAQLDNSYSPGASNNVPFLPTNTTSGTMTTFGPAWAPGTQLYDNLHHFFQTGFSQTHNVSAEFGTKNVGFIATGQYFTSEGVIPFNKYTKYNFKISNTTKIGKYISITPAIAYTNADNLRPLKSTATSSGAGGYLVDLYAWPANNDVRNYQDAKGNKLPLYNTNPNQDYDNPFWGAKNNSSGDQMSRWISTLGIDINPFSWLAISGRFGYDTYKDNGYVFNHPESYMLTSA